jgi:hypothetical protein
MGLGVGAGLVIHVIRAGYIRGSARRADRDVGGEGLAGRGRWEWPEWCCVLRGTVGAVFVEVRRVLGQDVFEVAPVEDQYLVEQLAAEGADPSFGDRVVPRRRLRLITSLRSEL